MFTLIPFVFLMFAQATILHRAPVDYPQAAIAKGVQGTVVMEVDIDRDGLVTDARVVSGPQELRSAALRSVLDWHFSRQMQLPATTQVPVEFKLPPASTGRISRGAPKIDNSPVQHISISGLNDTARDTLLSKLPVREGEELNTDLFAKVMSEVSAFDEHLHVTLIRQGGGLTIDIAPRNRTGAAPTTAAQRIRVGGTVQQSKLIQQTRPVYPPQAKADGIQGEVLMNAVIGTDGHMKSLELVSGEPVLAAAAMEAVRQWVYQTTLLNGEPVEVATQIHINFTLSK